MMIQTLATDMGIGKGDAILLMADLTRVAWQERKAGRRFDPQRYLDIFLEAVGERGTVVIPTFNYDLKTGASFDRRRTTTISGALGQAALVHPAFTRTIHPLHSFAVAGALQQAFLNADDPSSFGPRSPFALLHGHAFSLIAIDLTLDQAFTYVHHVEESMAVSYRRYRKLAIRYTDLDGTQGIRHFTLYAKKPGYVNDLKALEPLLAREGAVHRTQAHGHEMIRVDLQRAHVVVEEDILRNNARSIVKFTWRWWLRDLLRPFLKKEGPSRSATSLPADAPRSH